MNNLIKLVLVEPMGALNIGSVARLCENFGIKELRLVSPRCDPKDSQAKQMALRGKKILENSKTYESLIEAISDCPKVIATCGRINHGKIPLRTPEEACKWIEKNPKETPIAIIFGREDRGLTNQELLLANKVISLKTSIEYPSLNLSHAVAIVLYELNSSVIKKTNLNQSECHNPVMPKQFDDFLKDASELLMEVGFLLEHTKNARMNKLRSLLLRAEVRSEEVSLIRGIISQIRWALNTSTSSKKR
tara:strand:+ start:64333 stop:65076 length:744 start_codon:yes stop_codon:yes gene_type:complete